MGLCRHSFPLFPTSHQEDTHFECEFLMKVVGIVNVITTSIRHTSS